MKLQHLLTSIACLLATAATVQACPDHGGRTAVQMQPRAASAAALVAWKPRAWQPAPWSAPAALQVAIDPVDGTLGMPAPGELSTSVSMADEDLRPVSMIRRANGSGRAQLDERWESHAVASIGPDGQLRWTCVDGKHGADRFIRNPVLLAPAKVPAAPVWEEK